MEWFGIAWSDFLGPLFVIGLMGMILYFIMSSDAISQGRRQHPFPPTQRDIEATGRLWRRRWRKLTSWTERPSPPS
jgi:hypothetical protein